MGAPFTCAVCSPDLATWLREVSYPLLRAVAAWWMCWLVKVPASGGYTYNDLTDCTYENW